MWDGQQPSRVSYEWAVKGGKDSGVLDDVETKCPCAFLSRTHCSPRGTSKQACRALLAQPLRTHNGALCVGANQNVHRVSWPISAPTGCFPPFKTCFRLKPPFPLSSFPPPPLFDPCLLGLILAAARCLYRCLKGVASQVCAFFLIWFFSRFPLWFQCAVRYFTDRVCRIHSGMFFLLWSTLILVLTGKRTQTYFWLILFQSLLFPLLYILKIGQIIFSVPPPPGDTCRTRICTSVLINN